MHGVTHLGLIKRLNDNIQNGGRNDECDKGFHPRRKSSRESVQKKRETMETTRFQQTRQESSFERRDDSKRRPRDQNYDRFTPLINPQRNIGNGMVKRNKIGSDGVARNPEVFNPPNLPKASFESVTVTASQVVTQTPRQALQKVTEVPQTSEPIPNVAYEVVYEEWDDRVERAATTAASLDATQVSRSHGGSIAQTKFERVPTQPHDSPIPKVNTHGSDKGSMTLQKLMFLCTTLSQKVESLEADLKQTKQVYGATYTKLIIKVNELEKTVKTSKAKRKAKIVISDDEEGFEDPSKQGRSMIEEINQDAEVTLVTPTQTYTRRRAISTGSGRVSTASRMISTAKESVSTAGASMPVNIADMIDKERQRIARVHEAAQTFTEEEWENIRARVEADEELTQRLQAEKKNKYSEADQAKMLVDLINQRKRYFAEQKAEAKRKKPMTQAQQRTYIIKDFVLMESEDDKAVPKLAEARSSKRDAEEKLDQGRSKMQKIGESLKPRNKDVDELSQEELQQLMIIVPEQGMNVKALQTKYLIIDWEIYTKDTRKYWKIIRVGNHIEVYQFFDDMLKVFDQDNLVQLWSLVKERFSSTERTDDKERVLWVELKRLFEPDDNDELWES
nr:hypothetical protein [Tanacetum cinerariifolium]